MSETIRQFGYDDCPGHPTWLEPLEWLGGEDKGPFPLHLISNQPTMRLHSQFDNGIASRETKVAGREPVSINPGDAAARGIGAGDVVRLFNDRGACLAGAVLTDCVAPGTIQLSTGAWYDPVEAGGNRPLDRHGNPNVLTLDMATSRLAQAPIAHSALVEMERFEGPVPEIGAFLPPALIRARRKPGDRAQASPSGTESP
jgi:biotin/methionine sulfoxide reductase